MELVIRKIVLWKEERENRKEKRVFLEWVWWGWFPPGPIFCCGTFWGKMAVFWDNLIPEISDGNIFRKQVDLFPTHTHH